LKSIRLFVRFLMGVWMLFAGLLLVTVFGSTVIALSYFSRFYEKNGESLHKIAEFWAKTLMRANPWWKYTLINKENLPAPGKPVVLVANHQSQTDILALYLLGIQFRWLSKESMFRIPILGQAMRKIGYIGVVRGDSQSQVTCMRQSGERLKAGLSMVFFPEGTRSKDGNLLSFKVGAFKLAKEYKAAIVPVSLVGTRRMLPKGTMLPRFAHVKLIVHKALDSENLTLEELMAAGRASILEGLNETKN
jgi:1-acyl-sn-glycerol-3-phosphate acyltransferase